MSLAILFTLLAVLLHPNSASNIVRRLSEGDDDWYCITGPSGAWGAYRGSNSIKGNYQYGGQDSNNNDYWFISLEDAAFCDDCGYKQLYLRKSTHDNIYEIAPKLSDNCYITRCEDDATTPETCESWSSENFTPVEWVSEDSLLILKGKCPDVHTENYLTVTQGTYGCDGEFTKDASRNNIYIRNEPFVNPNWGDYEWQYAWYFNYPSQSWECSKSMDTMDYLAADYTTNSCGRTYGPPSSTLSFYN